MDGGLRRTETGRRVSPCRRLEFVGERSAKHRFPCGAAGIVKGDAVIPLNTFTGTKSSYSTQRKVNGTLHQTDKSFRLRLPPSYSVVTGLTRTPANTITIAASGHWPSAKAPVTAILIRALIFRLPLRMATQPFL